MERFQHKQLEIGWKSGHLRQKSKPILRGDTRRIPAHHPAPRSSRRSTKQLSEGSAALVRTKPKGVIYLFIR